MWLIMFKKIIIWFIVWCFFSFALINAANKYIGDILFTKDDELFIWNSAFSPNSISWSIFQLDQAWKNPISQNQVLNWYIDLLSDQTIESTISFTGLINKNFTGSLSDNSWLSKKNVDELIELNFKCTTPQIETINPVFSWWKNFVLSETLHRKVKSDTRTFLIEWWKQIRKLDTYCFKWEYINNNETINSTICDAWYRLKSNSCIKNTWILNNFRWNCSANCNLLSANCWACCWTQKKCTYKYKSWEWLQYRAYSCKDYSWNIVADCIDWKPGDISRSCLNVCEDLYWTMPCSWWTCSGWLWTFTWSYNSNWANPPVPTIIINK